MFRRVINRIFNNLNLFLNNMNLNKKFMVIYVFCVIFPLVFTDGFVFRALLNEENTNYRFSRQSAIQMYKSEIVSTYDYDTMIARAMDENLVISSFLDTRYLSEYDYFHNYHAYVKDSYLATIVGFKSDSVVVYADNPSITNSDIFKQLGPARDSEWYKRFEATGKDEALMVFFDEDERITEKRKFTYVRRMKNADARYQKIIVISNNYSNMNITFNNIPTTCSMYVCTDDSMVAFSNKGDNIDLDTVLERANTESNMSVEEFEIKGTKFKIYAFTEENIILKVLNKNQKVLVALLIATLILPLLIMKAIEHSILDRIGTLQDAFIGDNKQTFSTIQTVDGSDEISSLMMNYNKMVNLNNELTNTLYKEKLTKQKNDLARKNAELLALQSQINPHFLFNALESIRMHSILKGEYETAEMVAKLAVMERQNVDWQNDSVTVGAEAEFIRAYLQLQSYRFGDRLSFDIDIEEDCEDYLIPKLTLVTFVENACVHGIESKSSQGWIFVRVYRDEEQNGLFIEVEDTGGGMSEAEVRKLSKRMNSVTIDTIKQVKHVGILNACLRMKLMFKEQVEFNIESEQGVGMAVVIKIPLDQLSKKG